MDEVKQKLEILERKLDEVKDSVDKIKKIFFWTIVISLVLFILPLVGLVFAIPKFLSTYSGYSNLIP